MCILDMISSCLLIMFSMSFILSVKFSCWLFNWLSRSLILSPVDSSASIVFMTTIHVQITICLLPLKSTEFIDIALLSLPLDLTGVFVGDTRAPKFEREDPGLSSITDPGLDMIILAKDMARGSSTWFCSTTLNNNLLYLLYG